METQPRPYLSSIRSKLDKDLKESKEKQWMTPLKAAVRQLNISEDEKDRFIIDIKKYADDINPEELCRIPRDKILPHLLNCIWRLQVRSTKSESEYTETGQSKTEENASEDDSDAYETVDEDGHDDRSIQQEPVIPDTTTGSGTVPAGKQNGAGNDSDPKNISKKYKLLLDKVAPSYFERKPIMSTTSSSNTGLNPLDPISQNNQRKFSRTLWRHAINHMQPEYRLPTLILKKHQYLKREEPRNLGPGTYDPHYSQCRGRKTRGQMYSCTPRFGKEYVKTDCPDPGTYGNPYEKYWKMVDRLKHPCKTPLMQSGPCDRSFGSGTFKLIGSSLGPGDYDVKSSSILNKKTCSLRGPYDLFTPGRFDICHGYYMKPKNSLEPGQYGIYDTMKQNLFNRYNEYKGKLSKLNRDQKYTGERITVVAPMWPTAETEEKPGPGAYDVQYPIDYHSTCWGENYWAFNLSTKARGMKSDFDMDYDNAPTRYRPELADLNYCPKGCGFKSLFKSKTPARLDPPKTAVLTERLRGKDLPPNERHLKENDCQ